LAFTGSDTKAAFLAAGLLIGAGLLAVAASRSRRRPKRVSRLVFLPVGLAIAHSILPVAAPPACGPPPVLPESPLVALLPLFAAGILMATWRFARRPSA
jgi:hypothetical protein